MKRRFRLGLLMAASFLLSAVVVLSASRAFAEPRFAVRTGLPCAGCHINPSGGGMRNSYGRNIFARDQLPLDVSEGLDPLFDPQVNDTFSFGADFRLASIWQPGRQDRQRDGDLTPGEAGLFIGTPTDFTFFVMQSDLYMAADLGEHITLYTDLGAQGSYEVFGLFHGGPFGTYVKAGMFVPPYGTKLVNHSVAIRQPIGFDPVGKDAGVEAGLVLPWVSLQLMVGNGEIGGSPINLNTGPGFSGRLAFMIDTPVLNLFVGGSGMHVSSAEDIEDDDGNPITAVSTDVRYGPFIWASLGPFAYLGEFDWRIRRDGTDPDEHNEPTQKSHYVFYQELDLFIIRGLEATLGWEYMDRNTEVSSVPSEPSDAVHRVSAGIEFFPVPYVELDVMYRHLFARKDRLENGQDELLAYLHLFF